MADSARLLRTTMAAFTVVVLAACSTTTEGRPVIAADEVQPDGAVIARMNTGPYATTPSPPIGTAGDDVVSQALMEAHRLGPYATGPWQVFDELIERGPVEFNWTGPISALDQLRRSQIISDPLVDAAAKHGFFSGFSSYRLTRSGTGRAINNVVLEFPDAAAATAAADEMAAVNLPPQGGPPGRPVALMYLPDVRAMRYDNSDRSAFVQTVATSGPLVLFGSSYAGADSNVSAEVLAGGLITAQSKTIAGFAPTEPAKRADLPMDFTGDLFSRTLGAPDNSAPFIIGEWEPAGWLHFEADPITARAHFDEAGLEVVSQRLTTVFRTHNVDGARRLAEAMAAEMAATTDVEPAAAVPGLPAAKCFVRTKGAQPPDVSISWRRVAWRYKCVATADRYTYTAFSNTEADVHQQTAAQYRILVGK
ncbi:DUF7373 family lipoprotein [Mycolicibacterium arenosum]|uniref:Uncharacterized protein n=1 Tax=Mycolicibacterium arenosum TaxID=2952157 RepID=A0ABT1MC93_9MYCO|nr:hypothetical protein [Mycolicibacterium sp. CAU 1645]MCP9276789.1 hypothetical protein [Mycolicibacterium sp. CAU 1645]